MASFIPSSRIFSTQNNKVIDNQIGRISVNEYNISKPEKKLFDFSWTPLSSNEFSFEFLWAGINYVYYTANWQIDRDDIDVATATLNNVNGVYLTFNIKSETFVDLSKISVDFKAKYRYGESKSGSALGRPAIMRNENFYKIATARLASPMEVSYKSQSTSRMLLSSFSLVPAIYTSVVLTTNSQRSNSFKVRVFVPTYYNPIPAEQYGNVDSIVFESFEVSISGKEFENPEYSTNQYGIGENTTTINSNEFFQKFVSQSELDETETLPYGTFYEGGNGKVSAVEMLSDKIIEDCKDGKETATLRCSISENLSFYDIGNEVVPMVYGEDGVDRPMSKYADGTAKVFKVVGTKFIYDGAVWQELTLQEV